MIILPDIREISDEMLSLFLKEKGEKPFRLKQIKDWLWKKGSLGFDEMINLPISLREKLKEAFPFQTPWIDKEMRSKDGTVKFLFSLQDGEKIEGVLIPSINRITACLSSQVGCPLACRFCATGAMGFIRNLHFTEIWDQFQLMNRKAREYYGKEITHIVYMGMGEPLLNYEAVMESIRKITSPEAQGMSPSRITLSTVGITQGIRQLADEGFKGGLAVSLHTADAGTRQQIMPVTRSQPLETLKEALRHFVSQTGMRITLEYVMLEGINDSIEDAEKLSRYCKAFPVKINIIEYNATHGSFRGSSPWKVENFVRFLQERHLIVNIRKSKGEDIQAACGQLAYAVKPLP